jgi:methionyl-tRNA formyltransferase
MPKSIDAHAPVSLRVLYFGTSGVLSHGPLLALLGTGFDICGVVVPAENAELPIAPLAPEQPRSPLPIANPYVSPGIAQLAWQRDIPVFAAGRLSDPAAWRVLADLRPDIACASCFPWRIPPALLGLPPRGWLNVHPSLLPAYRGPAPLFWALRSGERTIGVTVHFMDELFDTGDIALQEPLALPDGVSGAQVDRLCAALGGELLTAALERIQVGELGRRAQPPGGSYGGWPAPDDWAIDTSWPARRAFNFMRGTDDWRHAYFADAGGARLTLKAAIGYAPDAVLGAPYLRAGHEVAIQCSPGVLRATSIGLAGR